MAGIYQSNHIKIILFFLISFLLGTQNTSAKTKLNVVQNGVVNLVEPNQSFMLIDLKKIKFLEFLNKRFLCH